MLDLTLPLAETLTALRRDLHQHPEIGFQEHRSGDVIAKALAAEGIELHRGLGGTGLVGLIKGTAGISDRMIGLRSDMDALPMQETTGLDYASQNPGVMHACGHDGHMAMLVGAGMALARNRNFAGTVALIFQPAEEGLGGARRMLAEGLFKTFPCTEIYGLHNSPTDAPNEVGIWESVSHAGADFFDIEIIGRGTHGAMPHRGCDPIIIASALVQALQSIVSRNTDAQEALVLSVTKIEAGAAYNVIPETATLSGTVRYLDLAIRELVVERMTALAEGIAAGFGANARVDIRNVFDVAVNDRDCALALSAAAKRVVGAPKVVHHPKPIMGSEDFGDMLRQVPGAMCTLGHSGGIPLHNPGFIFDDAILPVGAAIHTQIALDRLAA